MPGDFVGPAALVWSTRRREPARARLGRPFFAGFGRQAPNGLLGRGLAAWWRSRPEGQVYRARAGWAFSEPSIDPDLELGLYDSSTDTARGCFVRASERPTTFDRLTPVNVREPVIATSASPIAPRRACSGATRAPTLSTGVVSDGDLGSGVGRRVPMLPQSQRQADQQGLSVVHRAGSQAMETGLKEAVCGSVWNDLYCPICHPASQIRGGAYAERISRSDPRSTLHV